MPATLFRAERHVISWYWTLSALRTAEGSAVRPPALTAAETCLRLGFFDSNPRKVSCRASWLELTFVLYSPENSSVKKSFPTFPSPFLTGLGMSFFQAVIRGQHDASNPAGQKVSGREGSVASNQSPSGSVLSRPEVPECRWDGTWRD